MKVLSLALSSRVTDRTTSKQQQKSNISQVQQQPGPMMTKKEGVVNTKVHPWETPSLPRRRNKDSGEVEEGAKSNEGRRKGGGKCDNEGRRQQAEFEINYNSGKGAFFFSTRH